MTHDCEVVKPPSRLLMALEGRTFLEFWGYLLTLPILQAMPRGDGHPVLILPGFGVNDWYMLPLRVFLKSRGYAARGWGLGFNLGHDDELTVRLGKRLRELHEQHGRKVSLVGWSLGGIYAREMARARPDRVRFVVTLGSPFMHTSKGINLRGLYEFVSGRKIEDHLDPELVRDMQEPPPVPTTAIYSRTDGVAAHKCCTENEAPHSENIEVSGSHCGLAHNPVVLWALADRLAQPEDNWRPFERAGLRRFFYGSA